MTELKIESGIPIPSRKISRRNGLTAVLRKLKVGESVLAPTTSAGAQGCVLLAGLKGRATVRKMDENHVRIWRIK